jgi:hypothetical protein
MAKIGRNDACPCGSGKKYKSCCQNTFVQSRPAEAYAKDPEWLKIRQAEGTLVTEILNFGRSRYGGDFLREALEEFGLWGEYEVDETHLDTIFIPWAAFNWLPENGATDLPKTDAELRPLGIEYIEANEGRLDHYQRAFIHEACAQPYSFFVITDARVRESLEVRDILLRRTFRVKEAAASQTLKRGDIVFSRIVSLEGQAIMVGMAPIVVPPQYHSSILDVHDQIKRTVLKTGLKFDQQGLLEMDAEIRGVYFEFVELVSNPPMPELRNTDGDAIKFVKLYFNLSCSAQEALTALKSLLLPEFQESILDDAVFDEDGNLIEATFAWQKRGNRTQEHWDNTILGNLTINRDVLTAEVNSERRAEKIKSEITKRLKRNATFQSAEYSSVESKLEEMKNQGGGLGLEKERREAEELASVPAVQAVLRKQIEAHWEAWYNQRIPALKNKTPLLAARTKEGRERLEALLLEFERRNEEVPQPELRVDIGAIRKRLGL